MPKYNSVTFPPNIINFLLSVFCFWFFITAPLSTTKANVIILLINASLLCSLYFCIVFSEVKLYMWRTLTIIVIVYSAIFIAPLVSGFFNSELLLTNYPKTVLSRLFTLSTCLLTLISLLLYIGTSSRDELKKLLDCALCICFVFLFFALWQLITFYTNLSFPFEVRNWMHGVPPSMIDMFPKRLTSISEEPNFYAPLIIETFLLSNLILQNKCKRFLSFSIIFMVLILTFSSGAYVNVFILVIFYSIHSFFSGVGTASVYLKKIMILIVCIALFLWLLYEFYFLFEMFIYKMQNEMSGGSSRSKFMLTVSDLWFNSGVVSMIFGSGISSMSHLADLGVEESKVLFRITNNFFLDLLLEGGLLSLLLIFIFFSLLLFITMKNSTVCKYKKFSLFLTVHLIVTSMYRSEYLSMHFIWVLGLIFMGYAISLLKREKHEYN